MQILNSKQIDWQVLSTLYPTLEFKTGLLTLTATAGNNDYDVNTGVAKFANGLLFGEMQTRVPSTSWAGYMRGHQAYQDGTNVRFAVHFQNDSGATRTWEMHWVAVGY